MKKTILFLAAVGCVSTASAAVVFSTTGAGGFAPNPDISSTDLATGITPTYLFISGNETLANGSNTAVLTDGAQGTLAFGSGGGAVNTGNGPGLALYTIDLGAIFNLASVNVYTQTANTPGNIRASQDLVIYGHATPLDFGAVPLTTATIADNTTPLTSFGTAVGSNSGANNFGSSTTSAGNQAFRYVTVAAAPNGNAGGGESSIFTEIDVIEGVPEPSSALLSALAALGFVGRRSRK